MHRRPATLRSGRLSSTHRGHPASKCAALAVADRLDAKRKVAAVISRVVDPATMMYTYIVERTQIYLTARESAALDAAARRTGHTRSHLIREAIEAAYLRDTDIEERARALRATAGIWADRPETTEEIMAGFRTGRIARLHLDGPDDADEMAE